MAFSPQREIHLLQDVVGVGFGGSHPDNKCAQVPLAVGKPPDEVVIARETVTFHTEYRSWQYWSDRLAFPRGRRWRTLGHKYSQPAAKICRTKG